MHDTYTKPTRRANISPNQNSAQVYSLGAERNGASDQSSFQLEDGKGFPLEKNDVKYNLIICGDCRAQFDKSPIKMYK